MNIQQKVRAIVAIILMGSGIQATYAQQVQIGKQTWADKNLNVSSFKNGDLIPEAKTSADWKKAGKKGQPAWCYYENDPANESTYGKLYNWAAVMDSRGLAPQGWHISTDAEWYVLRDFLGGLAVAGEKLKSTTGWNDHNGKNTGTNQSGFNALPGGYRYDNGKFYSLGANGYWWSPAGADCWYRLLYYQKGTLDRSGITQLGGFSVRCVAD